ncbi:hypothetical protein BIW11_05722 [Tropilaelaps mercedesae]|uniref:Uncharacterized protein n=1 Tax=Tropilaelaps mercedesae TaxID=418985 RepID=A0A1V9Y143_9ACAR|nr:hypothetical protein BIW11_05722 [Tropilaelaps mercedesae]
MRQLYTGQTSILVVITLITIATCVRIARAEVVSGTSREAEFLSAATKTIHALDGAVQARNKKSHDVHPLDNNSTTIAPVGDPSAKERQSAGKNSSVANQVTTALSQFDLGLGYYKMCPFPFSYLHQCETSSECPGSDCCGMYSFPGPSRWRRSCCVPSSVTTIARVARLCIKSDKRPTITEDQQLAAVNEIIEHVVMNRDQGNGLHLPVVEHRRNYNKQNNTMDKSSSSPDQQSVRNDSQEQQIVEHGSQDVRSLVVVDERHVLRLSEIEPLQAVKYSSGTSAAEVTNKGPFFFYTITKCEDLDKARLETGPLLYLIKGIKKGWSSHTSLLIEGVKNLHKLHDSLQPKLPDLIKAHLKGGAADDVCPVIRVYHKHCGRPCSTHKDCKDPHYACCKVICDDPWDKSSFKMGLFCHRMIEGKLPSQGHKDPPYDMWGHNPHEWVDSEHPFLDLLMKHQKNKGPHHDSLGDKRVYLIG